MRVKLPPPTTSQSRRWCLTCNNWVQEDIDRFWNLSESITVDYKIYGKEVGESGTPHLQAFIIFRRAVRFKRLKEALGPKWHLEAAKGTSVQAATYCRKDGDFTEDGKFPEESQPGKRNDWDDYIQWVKDLGRMPTERELIHHNPSLYARYSKKCFNIARAHLPDPKLVEGEPRFGWQTRAIGIANGSPHDRHVHFFVDPEGNKGKSWVCRYLMTHKPRDVQVLRIGKRDDLAYALDVSKSIFLFDIPRGQMTFLQYSVLEMLKDRNVFSPKFESASKILDHCPHVIVFCNEDPDMNAMSQDRYKIHRI